MSASKPFSIIVAATHRTRGIGKVGELPWPSLPEDMAQFRRVTSHVNDPARRNAVIMGRKTWESIPARFRPLRNRINVILSRSTSADQHVEDDASVGEVVFASSLQDALERMSSPKMQVEDIFVIGGGSVYLEALQSPLCVRVLYTEVMSEFEGMDTFFPMIDASQFCLTKRAASISENGIEYRFTEYHRIVSDSLPVGLAESPPAGVPVNREEEQYLDAIRDIIDNGVLRGDRTGTGTLSKFGVQMRFNLRGGVFPLLTTKKVFWRGVAEELLWFVRGSTNAQLLQEKGIHIWDGNASREFLDQRGLNHREVGDLGPVYGFQVRLCLHTFPTI
jgi:dihydrofolate reductase / thymidylate synthase